MKTWLAVGIGVVAAAGAASAGYWAGFREAWAMGVRADAAPRGAIAIFQLRAIEAGRINDVKVGLEHDIDMGLIHWHDLSGSSVSVLINFLSGTEVIPDYEQYVRRLAIYRKKHKSALSDPEMEKALLDSASKVSPETVSDLKEGGERARRALDAMVKKYGE